MYICVCTFFTNLNKIEKMQRFFLGGFFATQNKINSKNILIHLEYIEYMLGTKIKVDISCFAYFNILCMYKFCLCLCLCNKDGRSNRRGDCGLSVCTLLGSCQKHAAYPRVHLASYVSPWLDRTISRPVCFLGQVSTVCLQLFTGLPPHSILVQGIGIQALQG